MVVFLPLTMTRQAKSDQHCLTKSSQSTEGRQPDKDMGGKVRHFATYR